MKVVSVGETLIDMISTEEVKLKDATLFRKYFGGSVANLVKNLSKMKVNCAIVTCVGQDSNGVFLKEELEKAGVDTTCVQVEDKTHTTMVIVGKSKASPEFFVARGADRYIKFDDNVRKLIESADIIHFSSFSLCGFPGRDEIVKIAKYAKSEGKKISFEPNYRDVLWEGNQDAGVDFIIDFMKMCDYTKPSLDDCEAIFGEMDQKEYMNKLLDLGISNVILTLGKDGFIATDRNKFYSAAPFAKSVVDTTGAGDAFWTGFYLGLSLNCGFEESLLYANAMSAFKVAQVGFSIYPSLDEINSVVNENRKSIEVNDNY